MGEIPLANFQMQIVGADLVGPFWESPAGNKDILNLICHCTGWAEAIPIRDKTNKSV